MRKAGTIALAAAALLALATAGWWFGSPWWTLWRMRSAAEAGDSGTLAAYVDFAAVRASAKAQLRPRFGRLGAGLAGPAVDALVSPTALRLALVKPRRARGGAGLKVIRTGVSEFRVRREGAPGGKGDLVFRRHGLGWKLAEVRIVSD